MPGERWNLSVHYHRTVLDAIPDGAATALDVGSGDGLLWFDLAAQGLEVVGIDIDLASIERSRADPARPSQATFLLGDLIAHPFQPGSFDLVAASAMLHHVDARAGLRRMAELVRPGGTVAVIGFARPSDPIDRAYVLGGFLLTMVRGALGRYWEHQAPTRWPPPLTMREMRALAESEMPGAAFGRAMLT